MNKRVLITAAVYLVLISCGYISYTYYVIPAQKAKENQIQEKLLAEKQKEEDAKQKIIKQKEEQRIREEQDIINSVVNQKLIFLRGSSELTERSILVLDSIIKTLGLLPKHNIVINSDSLKNSNQDLAISRGKTVEQYFVAHGVATDRIKTVLGEASEASVRFSVERISP